MGSVLAPHMCMGYLYAYRLPICVWAGPYTYGPACTDITGNPCFPHMRMSARMCIGMLTHACITTAMTWKCTYNAWVSNGRKITTIGLGHTEPL